MSRTKSNKILSIPVHKKTCNNNEPQSFTNGIEKSFIHGKSEKSIKNCYFKFYDT